MTQTQPSPARSLFSLRESLQSLVQWWRDLRGFWTASGGRRLQLAALLCTLWLAGFGTQWFYLQKELAGAKKALGNSAETIYVPPVTVLRLLSLGNQSFLADMLFLRAAHYFARHLITDSRLPWLDLYLEAIWGLDAHNRSTYRWGSQVIKFGQKIDTEVSLRASQFARLGLEAFPTDAWLYHEIAFNLRYGVEPKNEDDKKRWRELALAYLEVGFSMPNAGFDPNYLVAQMASAGREDDAVQAALSGYAQATADQRKDLRAQLQRRNKNQWAGQLAWYDTVLARDWPGMEDTTALFLGPKRIAAPPLRRAGDPDQWLAEPPIPPEVQKNLGQLIPTPPAGQREWQPDGLPGDPHTALPAAATATTP